MRRVKDQRMKHIRKLWTQNFQNEKKKQTRQLSAQNAIKLFLKQSLELTQIPPINQSHLAEQNHFRIAAPAD